MPGMMLPVRSRINPNTSNSGTMDSIMAKIASHSAETRLIFHGPGLTEAGQAHHHQFWVQCMQHVPAQAKLFQYAGAKVLNQNIRFTKQLPQYLTSGLVFEVEGD